MNLVFAPNIVLARLYDAFHMLEAPSSRPVKHATTGIKWTRECEWRGSRVDAEEWAGLRMHGNIIYRATPDLELKPLLVFPPVILRVAPRRRRAVQV